MKKRAELSARAEMMAAQIPRVVLARRYVKLVFAPGSDCALSFGRESYRSCGSPKAG